MASHTVRNARDHDLPAALRAEVEAAYRLSLAASTKLVDLGDECDIWRVDTSRGAIALRMSPASRSEAQLIWSHRLLAFVATRVPEAVAPMATMQDKTLIEWEGRAVSVYPWVEGEAATLETPHLCQLAASLLARLHKAMRNWLEPAPRQASGEGQPAELADTELDRTLAEIERSRELVRGSIHGDYYPRNLICREGRIVAVIDWDESHDDLLVQELAWAVWEFAQHPSDADLRIDGARHFLAAYAGEGGPVPASEYRLVVPLIRKRFRHEVSQALAAATRGAVIDWEYTNREIAAFHQLGRLGIEW
jgi:Ser/Thr protein kinase RdoA (MazF antagonist)